MKKLYVTSLLLALLSFQSFASHHLGNDMRAKQIGPNSFVIELRIASDISAIALPSNSIKIFEQITDSLISTVTLALDSTRTFNLAIPGSSMGFSVAYYSDTLQLANSSNGYYASSSHCCRGISLNHVSNSVTYTCDFPNPNIPTGNSNPKFVNYPDSLFFVVGVPSKLDFSCTDVDGDSLVYSITQPYSSPSGLGSKPFNLLLFNPAFNLTNPLGPGASVSINQSTGIVTGTTSQVGIYILAVRCEEYRNGIKIGEVTRDIVIPSVRASSTISIDENFKNQEIKVFPNPSIGSFWIELPKQEQSSYKLEIYDLKGKRIHNQTMNSVNSLVKLSPTIKGLYILTLTSESNQFTKRIIIE